MPDHSAVSESLPPTLAPAIVLLVTVDTTRGGYRDALVVGEFRAVAASTLISILGNSAAYLAVTALIYQRTGSPLLAALTFAVAFVPYLFGGALLSGLVDRIAPRRLMAGCDLLATPLVAAIAIPALPVAAVFVSLFLVGTLAPARSGAAGAVVVDILPGDIFVPGRSVLRIIGQGAQIFGAAAGGALLAPLGPHGAMLADAGSFLLSATIVRVGIRPRTPAQPHANGSLIRDSLSGTRTVWAQRPLRTLLVLGWVVPFVAVAPEAVAAPAVARAGLSPSYLALWMCAIPVGTVLGDLTAVCVLPARFRTRITWPLAATLTALLVIFIIEPPFPVAIVLLVATGLCSAYGLGLDQLTRDHTPTHLLARMYSLNNTGLMVSQGVGFAVAGALATATSPDTAVTVLGVAGLTAIVSAATRRTGPTSSASRPVETASPTRR
jgi:MFS family permease